VLFLELVKVKQKGARFFLKECYILLFTGIIISVKIMSTKMMSTKITSTKSYVDKTYIEKKLQQQKYHQKKTMAEWLYKQNAVSQLSNIHREFEPG
jgi:short subunit fatty acids transporter